MALIHQILKGSCINLECVKKGLTTHYNDLCWIKHPKLQVKYFLVQMWPQRSQKNLQRSAAQDIIPKTKSTPKKNN